MEHQLKLHIESVEDRIEELERDLEVKEKLNGQKTETKAQPNNNADEKDNHQIIK